MENKNSADNSKKIKIIVGLILGVLCLIVLFQNTASVNTRILFINVSMPRVVLLLVATVVGFILGVIFMVLRAKKKAPRKGDDAPLNNDASRGRR